MLSRVANSIYWMNRYLERADNVARFIDVNRFLLLDMCWKHEETQWDSLVLITGDEDDFNSRYKVFNEKNVIHFLTFDKKNPNSIISCIQNARENARTLREILSSEMWKTINNLYHLVDKNSRKRKIDDLQEFFSQIHQLMALFSGYFENTMSHGEGWHFSLMGKMIERADKTARILDVKYFLLLPKGEQVGSPYDSIEWSAVLKSVSGFEMYCKQFHRINYLDVTKFLTIDPDFPRSILFCIQKAADSLNKVTQLLEIEVVAEKEMEKLSTLLDEVNINNIIHSGLHEFIDLFQYNLNIVDNAIHRSFFSFDLLPSEGAMMNSS